MTSVVWLSSLFNFPENLPPQCWQCAMCIHAPCVHAPCVSMRHVYPSPIPMLEPMLESNVWCFISSSAPTASAHAHLLTIPCCMMSTQSVCLLPCLTMRCACDVCLQVRRQRTQPGLSGPDHLIREAHHPRVPRKVSLSFKGRGPATPAGQHTNR